MFFLTDLDPNAKVKGSRDPLGTLSVWTGFARQVVGNLTTQTTSLDDFRVLLIGAWLIDQTDSAEIPQADVFLAWEQLASYARLTAAHEEGFRGVTRAKKYLAADEIWTSADREHQILTNQQAYGIWGLYRAAAWRCGLLSRSGPLVSAPPAVELINHHYVPLLESAWGPGARHLIAWVKRPHRLRPNTQDHRAKLEAIAACISGPLSSDERDVYLASLVNGGADGYPGSASQSVIHRQTRLADHLQRVAPHGPIQRDHVRSVAEHTESDDLRGRLEAVLACESLLAPAVKVFSYVSQQHGVPVEDVVATLERHFDPAPTLLEAPTLGRLRHLYRTEPDLLTTFRDDSGEGEDRWLRIGDALHRKDFRALILLLMQQNALVSRDRGGSVGWVTVNSKSNLDVNLVDRGHDLPQPEDVAGLWVNPYFLDNLAQMNRATGSAA